MLFEGMILEGFHVQMFAPGYLNLDALPDEHFEGLHYAKRRTSSQNEVLGWLEIGIM